MREWLSGKKTYILCGAAVVHGVLDWFELLPDEGSFDVGNTTAIAEVISGLALMAFRVGLANVAVAILDKITSMQKQLDELKRVIDDSQTS
jgi:hypothetical protein